MPDNNADNANVIPFSRAVQPSYNAAMEQSRNVIGQRIAEARKKSGLSLATLSNRLKEYGTEIQAPGINKWEKQLATPNPYQLIALSKVLGIVDIMDFFTESGSSSELNEEGMKKLSAYKADLIATGKYRKEHIQESLIQYKEMPVSSLPVSAGTGAFLDDDSFEMVSIPAAMIPDRAEFGVRVSGDSMEPAYHDGQIVWVEQSKSVEPGRVGVFICDGEGFIKVYGEQEPEDTESYTDSFGTVHGQPVLISLNKAYKPKLISPEVSFEIVGKVL